MVAVDPGLVQPPAEATIMDLSASLDGNRVFDAYVSAIKETFGSEPWEDIERFAERVWAECRFDGDPDWAGIRERIRAEWPTRGGKPPYVVATGGLAPLVAPLTQGIEAVQPDLTLVGLRLAATALGLGW